MNTVLTLLLLASMCAAFTFSLIHRVPAYQFSLAVCICTASALAWSHLGAPGLVATAAVAVLIPLFVVGGTWIGAALAWWGVRSRFPDEPKRAPGHQLGLSGAYRLMWSLQPD